MTDECVQWLHSNQCSTNQNPGFSRYFAFTSNTNTFAFRNSYTSSIIFVLWWSFQFFLFISILLNFIVAPIVVFANLSMLITILFKYPVLEHSIWALATYEYKYEYKYVISGVFVLYGIDVKIIHAVGWPNLFSCCTIPY